MNQTWENSTKKLVLGPILAHLAQIWTTIPPPRKRWFTEQNYNHSQKISEKWRKLRKSCNHNQNINIIHKEKLHYNFLHQWKTSRHDLGDKGICVERNEKLKLQPSTQSLHEIATLNLYFKSRFSVKPNILCKQL